MSAPDDWSERLKTVLGDYAGDEPLPFPLEDMAGWIAGDWGGSMADARAYLEAARRIGRAEGASSAAKLAETAGKGRQIISEAADTVERLSAACEAALVWLEGGINRAPSCKIIAQLRQALGMPRQR